MSFYKISSSPRFCVGAIIAVGFVTGCPEMPTVQTDAGLVFAPPSDGGGGGEEDGGPPSVGDAGDPGEDAGPGDGGFEDAGDTGSADGGPVDVDGGLATVPSAVLFVFDQDADTLYRFLDQNGDGDAMDPGEMTAFFDDTDPVTGTTNSQGIVTVSESEVWVTDNADPTSVIRLVDLNGDGDALDLNESEVMFDGVVAVGEGDGGAAEQRLLLPMALTLGADGALYLYDNNTLDKEAGPEAIYRLNDTDGDGTTTTDEVETFAVLSPAGPVSTVSGFDVVVNAQGRAFFIDTQADDDVHRIYSVDEDGQPRVYLDGAEFFSATDGVVGAPGYTLSTGRPKLDLAPDGQSLLIVVGTFPDRGKVLLQVQDTDLTGKVDAFGEARVLWSAQDDDGPDLGTFGDFASLAEGDVIACEGLSDRVVRLFDRDGDGNMNGPGEVIVVYDPDQAAAAGLPILSAPRFCHGARLSAP